MAPGTKLQMALPVCNSQGAQTADCCAGHGCSESSEVPLAFPSSRCGRKAQLDHRSEVWLRLGLCPHRGNGTAPPHTETQLCHLAVPVAAVVSDRGLALPPPGSGGARNRHGSQLEASSSVVPLCGRSQVSDPPALDSRTPSPPFAQDKGPRLFPAEVSSGMTNGHSRPTHALQLNPQFYANTPHAPPVPQFFFS